MLPTGYKLLECIESTGSQYVDTGVKPTDKTKLVWTLSNVTGNTYAAILTAPRFGIYVLTTGRIDMAFGDTGYTGSILTGVTFPATISIENGKVTANGVEATFTEQAEFTHTQTLPLFGSNSGGTVTPYGIARLHGSKVWDNGTLIRDFIPCMTDSGEVGLWDDVNEVFYGDAAGVGFVAGDELLEVEYIESTGTQYVDTSLYPTQDTHLTMDVQLTDVTDTNQWLCGGRIAGNNSAFGFFYYSGSLGGAYGAAQKTHVFSLSEPLSRMTVDLNKNVFSFGGDTYEFATGTFTSTAILSLLARNTAGTIAEYAYAKLYSCQIWDGDTLVRHYIPMVTGGGVAGLYDLVNNTFSTDAAGGNFVAGPRIVELPEGYTQVEYIESSGTQYIDTKFKPSYQSRVVMDISDIGETTPQFMFGSRNSSSSTASQAFTVIRRTAAYVSNDYFGTARTSATVSDATVRTTIDKNANVATMYGQTLTNTAVSSGSSDYNLYLLAVNNVGIADVFCSAKMYSCRIYDAGVLVRDYIPCTNSSGAGGLYDLVTDTFYANAGTGAFTVGAVVDAESQIPDGDETILITPENFRSEYVTESAVSLAWDAVDTATGYKLYRNLALISDQTETEYTDTGLVQFASYQYDVIAYNEEEQGAPATLVVNTSLVDLALALVTDRTEADVARVKELANKWMDGTITEDEKTEYLSFMMKGAYNFTDLNRVERAVEYINDLINNIQSDVNSALSENNVASDAFWVVPFAQLVLEVKTNWGIADLPTASDLERYLDIVSQTTDRIPIEKNLPVSVANNLKYDGANEIEKALLAEFNAGVSYRENMKQLVFNTAKAFVQSGEIYGGEF